jgi:type II restriction enzyme
MLSPIAEKAIEDAQANGKAILKFISANDAGITGSHQAGFYMPKSAWKLYAPFGPDKGTLQKSKVRIFWQCDRYTDSIVTYYGRKSRDEYRLTCFGKAFPYLQEDMVGDLLLLIPQDLHNWLAYVIDEGPDIDDVQAALGVEIIEGWGVYDIDAKLEPLAEDACIDKRFRAFAEPLAAFPTGASFSTAARDALLQCVRTFANRSPDDKLLDLMKQEYRLFKLVERQLCLPQVKQLFQNIDDFLKVAATIMNRRKARAGRSMENHVEYLLREAQIPFDCRPDIDGEPDIVIPGKTEYNDPKFPDDRLFMVGVKTTCKDRWRQILNEGQRIPHKHLMTIQEGISRKQLLQMQQSHVTLIVPKRLHTRYPLDRKIKLLDVEGFIKVVRHRLAS